MHQRIAHKIKKKIAGSHAPQQAQMMVVRKAITHRVFISLSPFDLLWLDSSLLKITACQTRKRCTNFVCFLLQPCLCCGGDSYTNNDFYCFVFIHRHTIFVNVYDVNIIISYFYELQNGNLDKASILLAALNNHCDGRVDLTLSFRILSISLVFLLSYFLRPNKYNDALFSFQDSLLSIQL